MSQNITTMIVCTIFLYFMSLVTAPVVKNSHIFVWNLLHLSKKCSRLKLKGFKYQILTTLKIAER